MTALSQPTCPGLAIGDEGLVWIDSIGRHHLLAKAKRLTLSEAATRLRRDERTVRRYIEKAQLYPIARRNPGSIEVYEVGVEDYLTRATMANGGGVT